MGNVFIDENTMKAIANAIRYKLNETGLILPKDMASKILQINGTENTDTITLSDLPSYYQEITQAVADEINVLGDEYVSFIVVTDTHGSSNSNNSQSIIRYLLKKTSANKFFHLGDVVTNNWSDTDYQTYFNPFQNCIKQVFFTLGNHEWFNGTSSDHAVIYQDILQHKFYLQGNPSNFYYYFDDNVKNVRYLVINTSETAANAVSSEQLEWITNNVQLPSSDWKLIVFGHMDIMPNDPITSEWQSNKASAITNALSSTNGTIIGYFCGHEHIDRISKINDTFYQVGLLNDSCAQETAFTDITTPTRTSGTVSEQAVSVISVNLDTGVVAIRRIGAGENLTYTYTESEQPTVTTYTITRNLTNCTSSSTITSIEEGSRHTETFTANSGYTLDGASITITMGGTDISPSYSDGTLNIENVTGNIIINIVAVQETSQVTDSWTDGVAYTYELINDEYVETNGTIKPYSTWSRSDYLYCKGAAKLGFVHTGNSDFNCFYDENKTFISAFKIKYAASSEMFVEVPSNAAYFIISSATNSMDGSNSSFGGRLTITPYANA